MSSAVVLLISDSRNFDPDHPCFRIYSAPAAKTVFGPVVQGKLELENLAAFSFSPRFSLGSQSTLCVYSSIFLYVLLTYLHTLQCTADYNCCYYSLMSFFASFLLYRVSKPSRLSRARIKVPEGFLERLIPISPTWRASV